jgi:hypothetical protein
MDNERQVIAQGSYGDGLSWLIWAQRQQPRSRTPAPDELLAMIRVTAASRDWGMLEAAGNWRALRRV